MIKRTFDILASLGALILLAPLFAVIAILIKIDSSGPVFFRQERVGRGGRLFQIFKFRSMVANAPKLGPQFTASGDPRITGVGRILRKTSLDELPQFINVLRGDMSLVGPRPNVPAQRSEYTDTEWNLRNSVLPGVTGLAQAVKRSSATPAERTRLDLEYVQRNSLRFDLQVIWLTVRQVLRGAGTN